MLHIRWVEPQDVISCFYASFLVEPSFWCWVICCHLCLPFQVLSSRHPARRFQSIKIPSSRLSAHRCRSIKIASNRPPQPVRPAKELLSAADKTLTTKKTASTRFAPIILDKEVKAMREQAIPKNTRKLTNWATTVWIDWTEYRRSTTLLLDLVIHLMNN